MVSNPSFWLAARLSRPPAAIGPAPALRRPAIHDADHPCGVDGEDLGFALLRLGLGERQPQVWISAVDLPHGDLPVARPELEAYAAAQRSLDEGRRGEFRRRQHRHVPQETVDRASEGDVEDAQDDPCPRSQLLQLQGDVQVGKVGIAEQAARSSLLYARILKRFLELGVADDQSYPRLTRRTGKRCFRPRTDRRHLDSKLAEFLEHAHPETVIAD